MTLGGLWLLASLGLPPLAGPGDHAGPSAPATPAPQAGDSSRDSTQAFIPLARRTVPGGAFISALVVAADGLWAVGDSGLVAFSPDDSVFRRLEPPDHLPLHCAVLWDGGLTCAGDSGRVFRVSEGKIRRAALRDHRAVRDLSCDGAAGLLGGDEGLLARSLDGGRSWDTLAAPLPMRFGSVLCRSGIWWAGGAGGRLFISTDQGRGWEALEALPAPVADLAAAAEGAVVALDRQGGVTLLGPGWRRLLGRAQVGEAHSLVAVTHGWAVGGEAGRISQLDTLTGLWRTGRLPVNTVLGALTARGQDLLMGGAWSTMAIWRGAEDSPVLLSHSLTRQVDLPEAAEGQELAVSDSAGTQNAAGGAGEEGRPRYFQNVLETDTRCTTPPTRMRQLLRSYDNSRWLGVTGRAMLAVDVSAGGELDSLMVLDEWPAGVGIGQQARQLASGLTFTPGFRKSGMVRSRMLLPVVFAGSESDYISWASGASAAGALLDSVTAGLPRAASPLAPKALVKAMGFPRKAKRFVWEGEAVVEYRLRGDTIEAGRVLWESEAKYGFGAHALEVLPDLRMTLPDSARSAPGDRLRVVQQLRFDRKRYKHAAKEMEQGFRFSDVKLTLAEEDSVRYAPGLSQLEWLLNEFQGGAGPGDWPELDLELVLRHDGRVHDFHAVPRDSSARRVDAEALRGLAILFTWGHPRAATEDKTDTLAVRWKPAAFVADSLNQPPSLRALLRGVVY